MDRARAKVAVHGAVQGVGFRPFVYRLASELHLHGWVLNNSQGVFAEIEGTRDSVREFLLRLEKEKPPRAFIQSVESSYLDVAGYEKFEIRYSDDAGAKTAFISPDIATCADCVREFFDPADRRHRYPFTNCTNCGPRFSIIEALPYDRPNTSMKKFAMCKDCEREYHDPNDRRFHAQPNACARCGPRLQLWDSARENIAENDCALIEAAAAVRGGKILALKGIGGFQLIVDALDEAAVMRLRERKHREEKPFALMVPSLRDAREHCTISELEERLLLSPEAPIMLLKKSEIQKPALSDSRTGPKSEIASSVAPGNPYLGVMLPHTPLHHLLVSELQFPIVATSGNLSDEPICIDEHEALERLRGIADLFLVHDRPIVRHVDDSIVSVIHNRESMLRRARGYAPLPITIKSEIRKPALSDSRTGPKSEIILAVGAHLKNTVALKVGNDVFISQHIGDLATEQAYSAFVKVSADLPRLYDVAPQVIACDLHPDYLSTKFAMGLGSAGFQPAASGILPDASRARPKVIPIQHHWAHVASCMAENELDSPALGVSWDGTGYGPDGTIWGGEFLRADEQSFTRIAHLHQFRLPGGEAAVKEPRRSALGALYETFGEKLWQRTDLLREFSTSELSLLRQMLERNVNAPVTSSAGRLFDAVASLIGLRQRASFEGQAAMQIEFAVATGVDEFYPFEISPALPHVIDWRPAIIELLNDRGNGEALGKMSAKFHNMLTEVVVAIARKTSEQQIVLTGGCFQNRYLVERTIDKLIDAGFRPYWHQRVPPNDGGIALGQVIAASWSQSSTNSFA